MGYREDLRPASFKGFPFWVDETTLTGGLRAQVHEYAERNDHYVEPLGAMAPGYPVTAHLIGDDVLDQRKRFIELLRSGIQIPGTLVLPADGEIEAFCTRFRIRDSITREGRITRLGLTFVESGTNQFPEAAVNTGQVVLDQSDAGIEVLTERFSDRFQMPSIQPTFVVDAAVSLSATIVEAANAAIRRADVLTAEKDALLRANAGVVSGLRTIVQAPATLAERLTDIYRSFADLGGDWRTTLDEFATLGGILDDEPAVVTGTVSSDRQAENQAELQKLVRRTAAVEMPRVATEATLASSADAAALRDELDVLLDAEIIAAGDALDDQVFSELRDLRAKMVLDLDSRGARLPSVRTFRVPATLPALVIADRLYDDPTRDAEIVARNGIRSPGFIRSQTDLEVLAE